MEYLIIALCVIAILLALSALWRFLTLRSLTQVTLRVLPASGTHGWRHGVFRYRGESLEYFKLRSLAPKADTVFSRTAVTLGGHRDVTPEEAQLLSSPRVLSFSHRGTEYELNAGTHAEMAFTAWVEAAPDSRMDKMDPKDLLRRMRKDKP